MKLIVGLGNPGKEYQMTRHNVGFMMIDKIFNNYNIKTYKKLKEGHYFEIIIQNEKVIFLKPQSYMNLSGLVILKYMKYFKIENEDVLIIHDDMDIELGNFKLKPFGSSAGHNGIKNIEENLNTDKFKRMKIGISKSKEKDKKDYVLSKFSKSELLEISKIEDIIINLINDYITLSFENLMNKYNKKNS